MTRRGATLVLALGSAVVALPLLAAAPAAAHVTVVPQSAAPGALETFTFTVPNEEPDQSTVALDVRLPAGFRLEAAQSLPGWTTVVESAADRTPVAVHWTGGRIPPQQFATFEVIGRLPATGTSARFPAVQHYDRTTVAWTQDGGDEPAPAVTLTGTVKNVDGSAVATSTPSPGPDRVPLASAEPAGAAAGQDSLARSRSSLALALSVGALLLAVGGLVNAALRRRGPAPAPIEAAAAASPAEQAIPRVRGAGPQGPARKGSTQRRP
jgi:periplasmic copper chaperone A